MSNRFITGLLATGLLSVIFFGWITGDRDYALVTSKPIDPASLWGANQTAADPRHQTILQPRVDEPPAGRAPSVGAELFAPAVKSTSASQTLAGNADTSDSFTKQDLHGAKSAADSGGSVDRVPDRESPEFALVMAAKNVEMNALYGKQAAEPPSSPGVRIQTPQAPQTRKSPT